MSRRLIVTAALAILSATSAIAADAPLVATLGASVEKQKPVLGSIVWQCEGTTCTSVSDAGGKAKSGCRAVAKRFGQVVAFTGSDGATFDQEQLVGCNKGVLTK